MTDDYRDTSEAHLNDLLRRNWEQQQLREHADREQAYFEQAKRDLPWGTIGEWLAHAQALKLDSRYVIRETPPHEVERRMLERARRMQ